MKYLSRFLSGCRTLPETSPFEKMGVKIAPNLPKHLETSQGWYLKMLFQAFACIQLYFMWDYKV